MYEVFNHFLASFGNHARSLVSTLAIGFLLSVSSKDSDTVVLGSSSVENWPIECKNLKFESKNSPYFRQCFAGFFA